MLVITLIMEILSSWVSGSDREKMKIEYLVARVCRNKSRRYVR